HRHQRRDREDREADGGGGEGAVPAPRGRAGRAPRGGGRGGGDGGVDRVAPFVGFLRGDGLLNGLGGGRRGRLQSRATGDADEALAGGVVFQSHDLAAGGALDAVGHRGLLAV